MCVIKIATLNINGMTATTRVGMLYNFVHRHELDILFLEEFTNPDKLHFRGYEIHHIIGTSMRGTAILLRNAIPITKVHKLPSRCAMSAEYNGLRLINVYAPSGLARRSERENLFNTELPTFFFTAPSHKIIGRDFNCVLNSTDTTSPLKPVEHSEIVDLIDTWTQDPLRATYTHHFPAELHE